MSGIEVIPVSHLSEVMAHIRGHELIEPVVAEAVAPEELAASYRVDFNEVAGQESVKRVDRG